MEGSCSSRGQEEGVVATPTTVAHPPQQQQPQPQERQPRDVFPGLGQPGRWPPRVQRCMWEAAHRRTPPQGPHPQQQPSYLFFAGLHSAPWWDDLDLLPWVKPLEEAYEGIKEEVMGIVHQIEAAGQGLTRDQDPQRLGCKALKEQEEEKQKQQQLQIAQQQQGYEKEPCSDDKDANETERDQQAIDPLVRPSYLGHKWGVFWLWKDGRKIEYNCKQVPITTRAVEAIGTHLMDNFSQGHIYISILEPGAWVRPHYGPANLRLRGHLGLVVPPSDCYIRVADEKRTWQEGKVLVFDDSFEHEVRHDGEGYRIVLIVDVWHPVLSEEENEALRAWFASLEY
eukprot:TRINITY_DN2015_c2_g1_i1.p1 TRINITY_DN2015_c2_g1~~TRINITY_DN2015_c2_g1_i1.p1  ORF type:complete len:340 (+),score=65.05 TRINITY_DN2015_c2_g1_i1:108-1127(+)